MKKAILTFALIIFLFGTNYSQTFDWVKGMDGSLYSYGRSIVYDNSGNIYTTGSFSGTTDFNPGSGTYNLTAAGMEDIFVQKLDSNGNFIWAKRIGGNSQEWGVSIAVDNVGNTYITGFFKDTVDFNPGSGTHTLISTGIMDIYIEKLDSNGNFIWVKQLGSGGYDEGLSIALDNNANVYTTGYFVGTIDFNPGNGTYNLSSAGNKDIFIQKLDKNGIFIWAKRMGANGDDQGRAISIDNLGNVYTAGFFKSTSVDFDPGNGIYNLASSYGGMFLQKLDSNGNFIWAKKFGYGVDITNSITIDSLGNVYATGCFSGTSDFDPGNGTYNLSTVNGYDRDIFILKLDPNGNFVWANRMGNNSYDEGYSICTDKFGNVYTTGYFTKIVDFNPGSGTFNLVPVGQRDIFVQKLDSNGDFIWAKGMGGFNYDDGDDIKVDKHGNIYLIGTFSGTVDFNPGNGSSYLSATGHTVFIQKMKQKTISFTATPSNFNHPPFHVIFTNISSGRYNYIWSFGDGNISNLKNPTHTYFYNGTYTVTLFAIDTLNNTTDTAMGIITCNGGSPNPCSFTSELTQIQSAATICAGDSFKLSATPNNNVTYAWRHNGTIIQGANDSIYYAKQQGFYMAILSNSNCSKVTNNHFSLLNYPITTPLINVIGSISPCSNDSVRLEAPNGYSSYLWSNGIMGQDIYVSASGIYTVETHNSHNCIEVSPEIIINVSLAQKPEICAVGVKANTNHNIVKWQAVVTQKIDSFRVYQETNITNNYKYLGSVAYSDPHEFEDLNAYVQNSQYAYKITAIDSCGKESVSSSKHKTIFLTINKTPNNHFNLFWQAYEGFSFSSYKIYRGTDSTNLSLLKSIPSTDTTYLDSTNTNSIYYYQIEVISNNPCGAKSYGISRSNIFTTKKIGSGIASISTKEMSMIVIPNPNKGIFILKINATSNKLEKYQLELYSIMGKLIHKEEFNGNSNISKQMNFGTLSKGVYLIRLRNKGNVITSQFIVE